MQTLVCILDSFNNFLELLTNELHYALSPCKMVHHKIKVVPKVASPSKAPYRLNQKELKKLKRQVNDLFSKGAYGYSAKPITLWGVCLVCG
jgi:hypothetical protein